ncbi:MAG: hypothetical protein HRU48_02880 [Vibrio sp.]|uniref:hypothetical protein n=2 Tax=Vibrionaceae TaxID=641 RepID=UPI001EB5733C|nr:hypothetical protein [Vibrio sp.]NRB66303.1 hypothetical protein [Vibrio sp.]
MGIEPYWLKLTQSSLLILPVFSSMFVYNLMALTAKDTRMLGFFRSKKDEKPDRLLALMLQNHERVTISHNGVVRVNLENEDVKREIQKHIDKLKELDELEKYAV